ncbi:DUF4214 domain-containing protein [Undibacterium sp. SXout7W]|uniref:DUF4214 domain-containing protein n=1 Tax=Undibacterium sp. SXout7W TaxID=3413049 RepID=UPI003BF3B0C5
MATIHVNGNGLYFSTQNEMSTNVTQTANSGTFIGQYSQQVWTGTNLTYSAGTAMPTGGTLLSFSMKDGQGIEQYSISGFSYSIQATDNLSNLNNFLNKVIFGNDTWTGTAGNDIFFYGFGNDIYIGGDGIDTLNMGPGSATASSNFTIAVTNYGYALTFAKQGTNISGQVVGLSGIDRLQFSDKSFALDKDGNAGQAYRLYQAAFDRTPDAGGLGYWISHLDSGAENLKQVASGFINSAEFKQLYGANLSDAAYLTALYQNVLHRAPDQSGFDYWNGRITAGASRADILVNFSESQENIAQVIGQISHGMEYIPYTG